MTGENFMPKLHLKQPELFKFLADHFLMWIIHPEWISKLRKTGNLKHLYKNELDKIFLAYDAGYSDSKDLAKRTISDKFWRIQLMKLLEIANVMDIKEH